MFKHLHKTHRILQAKFFLKCLQHIIPVIVGHRNIHSHLLEVISTNDQTDEAFSKRFTIKHPLPLLATLCSGGVDSGEPVDIAAVGGNIGQHIRVQLKVMGHIGSIFFHIILQRNDLAIFDGCVSTTGVIGSPAVIHDVWHFVSCNHQVKLLSSLTTGRMLEFYVDTSVGLNSLPAVQVAHALDIGTGCICQVNPVTDSTGAALGRAS